MCKDTTAWFTVLAVGFLSTNFLRTTLYGSRTCVTRDRSNKTSMITTLFGPTAFKMAVKRYHKRPECTKLLKVLSSKTTQTMGYYGHVRESREECRVVQRCLMHRLQEVYISRDNLTATVVSLKRNPPSARICPNVSFERSVRPNGSRMRRCPDCRIEYRIDFKH